MRMPLVAYASATAAAASGEFSRTTPTMACSVTLARSSLRDMAKSVSPPRAQRVQSRINLIENHPRRPLLPRLCDFSARGIEIAQAGVDHRDVVRRDVPRQRLV